ncbi:MAG: hypothetical protein J7K26_01400 [Candidatus Aenigmarchaeota archaeon]|nr:hypothetical protein [Candidatus Aenigmarchaeota archaeon]
MSEHNGKSNLCYKEEQLLEIKKEIDMEKTDYKELDWIPISRDDFRRRHNLSLAEGSVREMYDKILYC